MTASIDDIHSALTNIARQLGLANNTSKFSGGSVTLSNATTTVVPNLSTKGTSIIIAMPTNATAALTVRTNGLYVANQTAQVGFSLICQNGSATGQETLAYVLYNPV